MRRLREGESYVSITYTSLLVETHEDVYTRSPRSMDAQQAALTAEGTFDKTPLLNLIIYALERGLSGTFELTLNGASVATLLFIEGFPVKIRTTEPGHFLGEVTADLGLITGEQLAASPRVSSGEPRVYRARSSSSSASPRSRRSRPAFAPISIASSSNCSRCRRKPPLRILDGVDSLARFGGPPVRPDRPAASFGEAFATRPRGSTSITDRTLRRLGALGVRLAANAQIAGRFPQFGRNELAAVELCSRSRFASSSSPTARSSGPAQLSCSSTV